MDSFALGALARSLTNITSERLSQFVKLLYLRFLYSTSADYNNKLLQQFYSRGDSLLPISRILLVSNSSYSLTGPEAFGNLSADRASHLSFYEKYKCTSMASLSPANSELAYGAQRNILNFVRRGGTVFHSNFFFFYSYGALKLNRRLFRSYKEEVKFNREDKTFEFESNFFDNIALQFLSAFTHKMRNHSSYGTSTKDPRVVTNYFLTEEAEGVSFFNKFDSELLSKGDLFSYGSFLNFIRADDSIVNSNFFSNRPSVKFFSSRRRAFNALGSIINHSYEARRPLASADASNSLTPHLFYVTLDTIIREFFFIPISRQDARLIASVFAEIAACNAMSMTKVMFDLFSKRWLLSALRSMERLLSLKPVDLDLFTFEGEVFRRIMHYSAAEHDYFTRFQFPTFTDFYAVLDNVIAGLFNAPLSNAEICFLSSHFAELLSSPEVG